MTGAMQRRSHGRKRLNYLEQRAMETQVAQSSASVVEPTPSSATTKIAATLPPTSITALAVVGSLVAAAIILTIALCTYRSYKRRETRTSPALAAKVTIEKAYHTEKRHIDLENVSIYTEKPEKAVLTPRSFDNQVGWVPQTRAYPAVNVSLPEPAASPRTKTETPRVPLSVRTPSEDPDPRSPPPSYFLANGGSEAEGQSSRLVPIPPSPAVAAATPPPPTPPANRRTKTSFLSLSEQQPLPAAPSPRSESFAAKDLINPGESTDYNNDDSGRGQKLPRLMSVASTFTATLDDELAIKVGDTVRMLEEYRDGWCLVQRVGRIDAPKGAVPRFCLQERRGVVPILPGRTLSNASLKSQASGWR
ncbi:putative variant SH3 domain containing protein [Lyophyllum shimeji]|uniref:Variant SH3 domain containing protein n=1 Tax=Lyophyllum shimeji TaxID=47721 RepID=A0A9P3UIT3_LYOSH|nr:putative variant SH3 domain containing protein [Lyophyllum shimeji]